MIIIFLIGSSSSGLVGGIVGSTFFIIFIFIAIPVCILVCATSRARSSFRTTRIVAQPQPCTTATVVTPSADIPLQQVPPTTNPVASYPVQGYTNQQNPPYNPSSTAYSNVYGQGYPQYPYQPAPVPSEYTTTPQQPPPSYSEFLQSQYPAGGTGGTVPPPYPVWFVLKCT